MTIYAEIKFGLRFEQGSFSFHLVPRVQFRKDLFSLCRDFKRVRVRFSGVLVLFTLWIMSKCSSESLKFLAISAMQSDSC